MNSGKSLNELELPDWESMPTIGASETNSSPVHLLTQIALNGRDYWIVRLQDGAMAKIEIPMMSHDIVQGIAKHTPEYLLAWLEKMDNGARAQAYIAFKRRIATDRRLSEFWAWLALANFKRYWAKSSLTVSDSIWRCTRLPSKPSNMAPAARAAYFKKVRQHASALAELLAETRFDRIFKTALEDADLNKTLDAELYRWGDDEQEDGHVVAYLVDPHGKYRFDHDYPESALCSTLHAVLDWTYWDDQWDGSIFGSSAPIVQQNSASTPIIYFTCMLHDWFLRYGVEIPFPLLATLTNVALELNVDKQVDEEVVRKQVRRHQKRRSGRGSDDSDDSGQNHRDWENSVLLDPF